MEVRLGIATGEGPAKRSIKVLGNGECRNRHKCPEWRKGVPFFGILLVLVIC